ncbi:MAG TPA: hypothetical protein ENL05_00275, partial [Candidatus Moranbacteria bacterium]|nr:hypothetical protein [Candidatus Moranbacteria bacterium]
MSLFDIKNKLYKKKVPENLSEHDESLYNPETFHKEEKGGAEEEKDAWLEKRKGLGLKEKKIFAKGALF